MKVNFSKDPQGLVPAIIQDFETQKVLMLGYMNEESLQQTIATKKTTFFSRSKNRIWVKGEESGHFLKVITIKNDCDDDTLLIQVKPEGPTCHTGSDTCWNEPNKANYGFLSQLEATIQSRKENLNNESSYVSSLFANGINAIAQKVGEEAVEVIIEAKDSNTNLFLNESADLLFHYLILLAAKEHSLEDVVAVLAGRKK
ncbi:bifunctional phosphoribosyl-AMP cyclohydrolase/phosphoribosyl-ATP diphosphatase HisIE [Flavobacterium sp.]|uniref:bifunctional phosphoribosyl-AMP cyclohydrolase/phosphoribosyl-ATP diphosphatase HisIE n=1 Tax=Flavobacterium sp. TaxID=239 RepID=UPI0025BEA8A5|nr:bifunctional phosphoribosyl-AMP cyclohydrolase/phosphoribosyl-ATP diphosphatase HisIE [Flavobacterium sp.]MBA4154350.1 bifunctional phosphoribosyl-AMP cyclohydrolase/phosphoribosyl-ATP diphosphatase [Flavobacterium sp.]